MDSRLNMSGMTEGKEGKEDASVTKLKVPMAGKILR